MRVRDLGVLVVRTNGVDQPVRGNKASALLALLTIHVNHRVSAEALMDAAWGDRITSGTPSTLESHIWRLRQVLEPHRSTRQSPTILINDAGGYRLIGTPHSIDSLAFEHLGVDVRDLLAGGRSATALARADEALSLWRGRPFGQFCDEEFARPAVARLGELHQQLCERRVDALLAVGENDRALADLEILIASDRFRERPWGQRMLALHRSGRTEHALRTFQQIRTLLVEELGGEPGVELRGLHQKILAHDPELSIRTTANVTPRAPVEVHLPTVLTALVGRAGDVHELTGLATANRLVSLVGTAGSGKTRLAIEVAKIAAGDFPDGVWFIDLSTVNDPELVVDVMVSSIGFASSPESRPIDELRNYLRRRRMLLVLDNCEHVLPAVAHIVATTLDHVGSPDRHACSFLTTSREPLEVDGEVVWTLGPLSLLPGAENHSPAVELFLQRLRSAVPSLAIDRDVISRAATISVAVDGLPLALELAAARARSFTLDDIAAQATADPSALRRLGRGPADHRTTVRSAIDWSFRMLTAAEQTTHRRLAVLPGAFSVAMAAAVVGEPEVGDLLAQLVHRSMLSSSGSGRAGGPTNFRQLATVRAHAQHALADVGEVSEITARRDRWTVATLGERPRLGTSGEAAWFQALDDSYPTIRATLANLLSGATDSAAVRLPSRLTGYWYYRANMVEAARWYQLAHDAAANPADSALTGLALATALAVQGRSDLARRYVDDAVPGIPVTPPDQRIEIGEILVGAATAAWARDEYDLVRQLHAQLADVVQLAGDDNLSVLCDAVGSVATAGGGDLETAAADGCEVYQRATAMGNSMAAWIAAGPPMVEALLSGRPEDGIVWVHRVMEGHVRVDSRAGGMFIETRANFAAQSGDYPLAARMYAAARTQTRRAGMVWPRRALTNELLDITHNHLTAADFERAWQAGEQLTLEHIIRVG